MPNKRATGTRSAVIRCPNCGEDYSVTYKRCPFCDEKASEPRRRAGDYEDEDYEEYDELEEDGERPRRDTGRRLSGGATPRKSGGSRRGGGGGWSPLRIAGTVISLSIIVAAIWIVVTQIMPLLDRGNLNKDPVTTPPAVTQGVGESTPPEGTGAPDASAPPDATLAPAPTTAPTVPAGQTATGFTLNKTEFTISERYPEPVKIKVSFIPADSTGTITWTSSDPDVASVSADGLVSHGTKSGRTTITATMGDGTTQTCTVLSSVSGGSASSGGAANAGSGTGTLSLNKTDFSFSSLSDPSVQMKVNGTSSTPTWSIGNSSVATISSSGVVKPVGHGTTTVTCTVDGQTLECIVRCSF